MSLPAAWVDRIFERLTLVYGHQFLGRWSGLDLDAVKADWGRELSAYQQSPQALAYALDNLPAGEPPNVLQFRALCARRPVDAPKLSAPDPAGIKRIASAIAAGMPREVPLTQRAKECLDNLRAKVKAGAASPAQRDFLRRAEAGLGLTESAEDIGDFQPVPREVWPDAMRGAA